MLKDKDQFIDNARKRDRRQGQIGRERGEIERHNVRNTESLTEIHTWAEKERYSKSRERETNRETDRERLR